MKYIIVALLTLIIEAVSLKLFFDTLNYHSALRKYFIRKKYPNINAYEIANLEDLIKDYQKKGKSEYTINYLDLKNHFELTNKEEIENFAELLKQKYIDARVNLEAKGYLCDEENRYSIVIDISKR